MLIKEITVGGTYAFVNDYSEFSGDNYCYSMPDANPMVILDKKKVPVGTGTDSCGRPTGKRETVIVCKRYKIPASHMLALDLDIIDEKHPELVEEVTLPVKQSKNFVWEWDSEVEKVRNDHALRKQMKRYEDYCNLIGYLMLEELYVQTNMGAEVSGVNPKTDRAHLSYVVSGGMSEKPKLYVYDMLTSFEYIPKPNCYHHRYGWHHTFPFYTPDGISITAKWNAVWRAGDERPSGKRVLAAEKTATTDLSCYFGWEFLRTMKMMKLWKEANDSDTTTLPRKNEIYAQIQKAYKNLSFKTRLNTVDRALNRGVAEAAERLDIGLPLFDRTQDWDIELAEAKARVEAKQVNVNTNDN